MPAGARAGRARQPGRVPGRAGPLGWEEVSRRFLRAAGLDALYVDTGFEPEPLTAPAELAGLAGARAREIVRLEQVAEAVGARSGGEVAAAGEFAAAFRAELAGRTRHAAGVKSVAAYRVGLDLAPDRPTETEVAVAAAHWLDTPAGVPGRLADPVLHRFLIWCAADLGLPIQFHVGYGDRDVDLHRCNPLLLTGLLRAIEPAGSRCCCCTTTRSTGRPGTWPRCSRTCTWTPGWPRTTWAAARPR